MQVIIAHFSTSVCIICEIPTVNTNCEFFQHDLLRPKSKKGAFFMSQDKKILQLILFIAHQINILTIHEICTKSLVCIQELIHDSHSVSVRHQIRLRNNAVEIRKPRQTILSITLF